MCFFEALVLGILQGLTEFLPVSSSGHLVLGQELLGIDAPGVTFEVVVHLGTLLAVLWVYRVRVAELAVGVARGRREALKYAGLILLASVPAGLAGVLGRSVFERAFDSPVVAAGMIIVTGFVVYSIRFTGPKAEDPMPGAGQAVWIGVAQMLAILPGLSRSGTTVAIGTWRGVEVVRMAEFSFLMSVPVVFGAGLLQLGEIGESSIGAYPLAVAFVTAAVSGVLAIRLFVHMLKVRMFHHFAWYCWVVGSAYLAVALGVPGLR